MSSPPPILPSSHLNIVSRPCTDAQGTNKVGEDVSPVLTGPALVQELLHHHLGDVVDVLRVVRQNQVQLEHIYMYMIN